MKISNSLIGFCAACIPSIIISMIIVNYIDMPIAYYSNTKNVYVSVDDKGIKYGPEKIEEFEKNGIKFNTKYVR